MTSLVRFFAARSFVVNMLTATVIIGGLIAALMIPRALVPAEQITTVIVDARLPGASVEDMEVFVTMRMEEALSGMNHIEKVQSWTRNGHTKLRLSVDPAFEDLAAIVEESKSRIDSVRYLLPRDLRPIEVRKGAQTNAITLLGIAIVGVDIESDSDRRSVLAFRDRISRIPSVVSVQNNLPSRYISVAFDKTKLEKHQIDPAHARNVLREFLAPMSIGVSEDRDAIVSIEMPRGGHDDASLIALPLVINRAGHGVSLGDVANVEIRGQRLQEQMLFNGRSDYVLLEPGVSQQTDTITAAETIRQVVDDNAARFLPSHMKVRYTYDASTLVKHELDNVVSNGLSGFVIVLVILTVFLGWRISSMTALGLPFSYLAVTLIMWMLGMTFNLISTAAMLLVAGILVDDAIIVAEEYGQQLRDKSPLEAAVAAVRKVAAPVFGMASTTVVAFMPLLMLKSDWTWIILPLPIIVISAILISVFESFFILPNHLAHIIPNESKVPKERKWVLAMQSIYRAVLHQLLRFRYLVLPLLIAMLGGVGYLATTMSMKGDLNINPEAVLSIELDQRADSLDALNQELKPILDVIATKTEVPIDSMLTQLGKGSFKSGTRRGWKFATIKIMPKGTFSEQEERRFLIAKELRKPLKALIGEKFKRLEFRTDTDKVVRDTITIHISGGDRLDFSKVQKEIEKSVMNVQEIDSVFVDASRLENAYRFMADDKELRRYGLSRSSLQAQLRTRYRNEPLTRIREQGEEFDVHLEFESGANSLQTLRQMEVMTPAGIAVPTTSLGHWKETKVLRTIAHLDGLRLFQLDALYDTAKLDTEEAKEKIESALASVRDKFPGYHISVKPNEASAKAKSWAIHLTILCLMLVYLCLSLALKSLVEPVIVLLAVPFAFVGVTLAFHAHGIGFDIPALIGVIGLAGVVVNDSLVMATTIRDEREDGRSVFDACLDGGTKRFRAVVLTSLTTLAGVFPLAYGLFGSAGWLRSMVLAIGWGLLFATLMTLVALPVILLIFGDIRSLISKLGSRIRNA